MASKISISQIILFSIHVLISLASAQPIYRCNNTANYTSDSTYASNLNLLLRSIHMNTPTSIGFFNTSSVGKDSDQVYGHAYCQADYTEQRCRESLNDLIDAMTRIYCPNQKEATAVGVYGLRYANRPISGVVELEPTRYVPDFKDLSSDNTTQFYEIWDGLMEQVAENASRETEIKYATVEADYNSSSDNSDYIYVFMQCLPDLSASDCRYCLRQVVSYYRSRSDGKAGGQVQKPSCWFRWELRTTAAALPPPPPPPPSPVRIGKDPTSAANGGIASKDVGILVVVIFTLLLLLVTLLYVLLNLRKKKKKKTSNYQHRKDFYEDIDYLQFDIETLRIATNNFSIDNKLGEGGFGTVYKGKLPNGEIIAVKRWSKNSTQGEVEFENEVVLLAKLKHRNLVRLLGYCLQETERLLVYEFVPNQSLDFYIFDSHLDWKQRYKIIEGITRGILYLHQDSQLQIIHRDLKPSNILLDDQMNPKISDFGTARLFKVDQSQISTRRIVGTYGYMPPEYAIYGQISTKSDVFSFGVLVLEILSSQKVSHFGNAEAKDNNLLSYAWRNWKEGTPLKVMDKMLLSNGSRQEMIRCIHIALLCVQEDLGRRPSMASIVLMLSSHSVSLPVPSKPAYLMTATGLDGQSSLEFELMMEDIPSVNEISVSDVSPR